MTPALTDVRYTVDDAIATLTLDRPEARNAYSEAMVSSIVAALDRAEADDAVRVLILTGEGRAFSAGGDLKRMLEHRGMFEGDAVRLRSGYLEGIHQIPRRIARFDKPIVAAINGAAIGAGLDLVCMCDVRVASRRAKFGSTFVKVGLIPGDGGAYFLSRAIGFSRAMELILTGRVFDAEEGLAMGLLHAVVEPEEVLAEARRRAGMIAANAPLAVRLARQACLESWDLPMDAALKLAATYQGVVQNSADHEEGVRAILDKRDPEFEGR